MHMMPDGSMMPGPSQAGQAPSQPYTQPPLVDPMKAQMMQAQAMRQQQPQGMPLAQSMPPMTGSALNSAPQPAMPRATMSSKTPQTNQPQGMPSGY